MCITLYIASDRPLPIIPFGPNSPLFHATGDIGAREAIRARVSMPNIVRVGSYTGCGCGFQRWHTDDDELNPETLPSQRELVSYLRNLLDSGARVELYACWEGDEDKPAVFQGSMTPETIVATPFGFRERHFWSIVPS